MELSALAYAWIFVLLGLVGVVYSFNTDGAALTLAQLKKAAILGALFIGVPLGLIFESWLQALFFTGDFILLHFAILGLIATELACRRLLAAIRDYYGAQNSAN